MDRQAIARHVTSALERGQHVLLESEVYELLALAGLETPAWRVWPVEGELDETWLGELPGSRVVLKVLSRRILHKSDVGGVRIVEKDAAAVRLAAQEMLGGVPGAWSRYEGEHGRDGTQDPEVEGLLLVECVAFPGELGRELLLGARHSREFGSVLTVGIGGTDAEFLSARLEPGRGHAIRSSLLLDRAGIRHMLEQTLVVERLTGKARGRARVVEPEQLEELVASFARLVNLFSPLDETAPAHLEELEINPLVVATDGRLLPLDGLMRIGPRRALPRSRPVGKVSRLLHPGSVALVGVSQKMNVGRIILQNLLDADFPSDRIHILKPDTEEIAGVRCYARPADLPEKVDMLVLAVSAEQVPAELEAICAADCAESIIVIPGGIAEKAGGEAIQARIDAVLERARALPGGGPVINGSNCLGVYDRDAGVNTLFIPDYKLPRPAREGQDAPGRVALLSQSGAFMICRMSRLADLDPVYAVSYGNQMDLSLGDYMEALLGDTSVDTVACYVEGFADLDGLKTARLARALTGAGRRGILYKAGRSAEGQSASAGHTASIAGDYETCRQVLPEAGVELTETFEDFENRVRLARALGPERGPAGHAPQVAVVSNAGFECVGIADNLARASEGRLELAKLGEYTREKLQQAFVEGRLDSLVDVKNPLDLTPMATDAVWATCVEALLEDSGVDAAIVSIVPLTAAMQTLPAGPGHREDLCAATAICARLAALRAASSTPFVCAVDSGVLYDPLVRQLESAGIPVFRYADEATRYLRRHLCSR